MLDLILEEAVLDRVVECALNGMVFDCDCDKESSTNTNTTSTNTSRYTKLKRIRERTAYIQMFAYEEAWEAWVR